MTQSSPPTCSWRPGDAEALRIALSIPVTSAALAALNREMAQLQTHYPTGVCTAQATSMPSPRWISSWRH
jgi:hypothetical protein